MDLVAVKICLPTNPPRGFHVETTWKRPFPRHFNVESTWCVCRVGSNLLDIKINCFPVLENSISVGKK